MAVNSIITAGVIISGASVYNSVLSQDVRVNSYSDVDASIIFSHVNIGRHCRIRRAIIDRDVHIPEGTVIGYDPVEDKRRYFVTPSGLTISHARCIAVREPGGSGVSAPLLRSRFERTRPPMTNSPVREPGPGLLRIPRTMQCAGTLGWSRVGIRPQRPRPSGPSRRSQNCLPGESGRSRFSVRWRHCSGACVAADTLQLGEALMPAMGRPDRPTVRDDSAGAGSATPPAANTARVEVRPLEQDWSQIVRRCMDGDSGAWAEMVRTHQKRVYGLCYRFTGNAADAEDLTQDVFLKIYSNLGSFDATRGSLPVWITTMTRNLLVDNFRRTRNQRATSSLDDGWDQAEELKPADRLVAAGPTPHESAARKELAKMVQRRAGQGERGIARGSDPKRSSRP